MVKKIPARNTVKLMKMANVLFVNVRYMFDKNVKKLSKEK